MTHCLVIAGIVPPGPQLELFVQLRLKRSVRQILLLVDKATNWRSPPSAEDEGLFEWSKRATHQVEHEGRVILIC